jgi:hypothetical protein
MSRLRQSSVSIFAHEIPVFVVNVHTLELFFEYSNYRNPTDLRIAANGTKRSLMVSSSMPESSRSNAQTDSTYPPFLPDCYFQAHGFPLSDGLSIGAEKLPSKKVVQFGGQKLLQAESPITHKNDNNIFIVPRFFLCSLQWTHPSRQESV